MTEDNHIRKALKHASWHGAFLALQLNEIRAAIADFERYGTNGPRTPGQMLRDVLDTLNSAPPTPGPGCCTACNGTGTVKTGYPCEDCYATGHSHPVDVSCDGASNG